MTIKRLLDAYLIIEMTIRWLLDKYVCTEITDDEHYINKKTMANSFLETFNLLALPR